MPRKAVGDCLAFVAVWKWNTFRKCSVHTGRYASVVTNNLSVISLNPSSFLGSKFAGLGSSGDTVAALQAATAFL